MKKTLLIAVFALLAMSTHAQIIDKKEKKETDSSQIDSKVSGKNEITTNLFMLGFFSVAELGYERLFDNSSIGATAAVNVDDIGFNFSFISYYRVYFGRKKASGFFIEGNAVFYNAETSSWGTYNEKGAYIELGRVIENQFGFGVAAGGKFLNKNGFVGELFGGVVKLFNGSDKYYPRIGITLGKRF